ncbi:MAG: 5'-nucleotidase, lipoprotein e(P4) family [Gammaproteobacteria bacterium]|nr:5'-nucleotidase, lipoprotein e(P4) family [Gammaproteobacteria bacterium]
MNRLYVFLAAGFIACSCAADHPGRINLNAALWMQTSPEYRALALGAYSTARRNLDEALENPSWTALPSQTPTSDEAAIALARLPVAVILDIDETVLSTLPYQTWLVKNDQPFKPETWNVWVSSASAAAIPGALEFADYARDKGVTLFYLSNRTFRGKVDQNLNGLIEPVETHVDLEPYTISNLVQLGLLPQGGISNEKSVLLRGDINEKGQVSSGWALSDKSARRQSLASRYRILLMLGDNLNDFTSDSPRQEDKGNADTLDQYQARWGHSWIMLPNPIYGSWERRLYDSAGKLSADEIIELKLNRLKTWR